jgi:hypothetical protein
MTNINQFIVDRLSKQLSSASLVEQQAWLTDSSPSVSGFLDLFRTDEDYADYLAAQQAGNNTARAYRARLKMIKKIAVRRVSRELFAGRGMIERRMLDSARRKAVALKKELQRAEQELANDDD